MLFHGACTCEANGMSIDRNFHRDTSGAWDGYREIDKSKSEVLISSLGETIESSWTSVVPWVGSSVYPLTYRDEPMKENSESSIRYDKQKSYKPIICK